MNQPAARRKPDCIISIIRGSIKRRAFMDSGLLTNGLNSLLTLLLLDGLPITRPGGEDGMRKLFRKLWNDDRGNALIIAGAALPLLVGSAGLATDTIQWAVWKRQLQRAVDSAALAGVYGKVAGATVDVGSCPNLASPTYSMPVQHDLQINNHVLAGTDNITSCSIENSPSSGPWSSDANAVRVSLALKKKLGFSSLFISAAPTIAASATATVVAKGKYCVISLEHTNASGITFQGNAGVDLGCGMATNSRGSSAVSSGGSPTVRASPIAAVGAIPSRTGFASDTIVQPYSSAQEDPFADISPPASSTFPSGSCPNFRVNANETQTTLSNNTDYRQTSQGFYCMGSMTLNGTVVLPNGVYVIDGGNLSVGSQANVSCAACTFILTNRSTGSNATIGSVNMNGGAMVNLGYSNIDPYAGLLFYQDRRAQLSGGSGQANLINGNSGSSLAGSSYFPSTEVILNGTSGMQTDCIQLVARRVSFSGTTRVANTCPNGGPAQTFDATTIRLVA